MDQILQYLAQHTMAIEQLLSRGQTQREAAKPPLFDGEREKVVGFINACRLYISMRMKGSGEEEKISWVLTYVQGEVAEVWKENVLEEKRQGVLGVELVEELFTKMREEFREFDEESRKVDELRMLEQGERTCDEYVQIFKKVSRGSGYEGRPLVEEFKRGLNGNIRRRLAEAESPPVTIEEWWERSVRLDRNLRQSRAEEKVLGRKGAVRGDRPPEAQPSRGVRPFWNNGNQGGFRRGQRGGLGGDLRRREGGQGTRDPNAMEVDRSWGGDRRCFNCGMFGHMVRHCRNRKEVRGGTQETSKDQGDQ